MPWPRFFLPGIAFLLTAACAAGPASPLAAASPTATATPTSVPTPIPTESPGESNAPWALDLDLSGDLTAHVTGTAPSDTAVQNDCTGADSIRLGSWASTMAFTSGTTRYALYLLVKDYKGASVFNSGVNIEVASEDQSQVWQNQPSDPVTLTVGSAQDSGLLEAELSNVADTSRKLTIAGHWSCHS